MEVICQSCGEEIEKCDFNKYDGKYYCLTCRVKLARNKIRSKVFKPSYATLEAKVKVLTRALEIGAKQMASGHGSDNYKPVLDDWKAQARKVVECD